MIILTSDKLVIAEEVKEHEAGARVTPLKLRGSGALGGGLGGGAHAARRVPGGVGVVPWHEARSGGSHNSIITIDSIRLGHEYKLVIAGKLLVADHKGHPVFGIIKHLREQRLLPLQVQVLKVNSELIIVET